MVRFYRKPISLTKEKVKPTVILDTLIIRPALFRTGSSEERFYENIFEKCWSLLITDEILKEYKKGARGEGANASDIAIELERWAHAGKLKRRISKSVSLTKKEESLIHDETDHMFLKAVKIASQESMTGYSSVYLISNEKEPKWNRSKIERSFDVKVLEFEDAIRLL